MPPQPDDVLLSVGATKPVPVALVAASFACRLPKLVRGTDSRQLQSSLRNALASFGPNSNQYLMIKYMIDEYEAKAALESMSLSTSNEMRQ
jgi:hypothetical protein